MPSETAPEGAAYQQYLDSARESASQYARSAKESYEESPMLFCLAAFGLGIGVGTAVGASLAASRSRGMEQHAASIGRRVLDAIADYVPSSIDHYVPRSLKR
jgi:hypothetical protein